ncbi:MAG: hypothetical protein K0S34_113 [Bacillales bacterium]|jgi:hypothetical protein|nr:hypothetical protein [Bacillales bacterium]
MSVSVLEVNTQGKVYGKILLEVESKNLLSMVDDVFLDLSKSLNLSKSNGGHLTEIQTHDIFFKQKNNPHEGCVILSVSIDVENTDYDAAMLEANMILNESLISLNQYSLLDILGNKIDCNVVSTKIEWEEFIL